MVVRVAKTTVTWITANDSVTAESWAGMAEKLKAPAMRKETVAAHDRVRVLNRLGAEGWEVYARQPDDTSIRGEILMLKRKVR